MWQILGKVQYFHDTLSAVKALHTVMKVLSGDETVAFAGVLEPVFRYMLSTCMVCDEEVRVLLSIPSLADRAAYKKEHPQTEEPAVVVAYLSLLSRLFVQATSTTMAFLAKWESEATGAPSNGVKFLAYLVGNWIDRFDEIAQQRMSEGPWYRKLCCMALLAMLPALAAPSAPAEARSLLQDRLFEILNCSIDLLTELKADA